jgi:hypothetical protein
MIVTLAVLWAVGRSSAGERVIPTVQTMPQWDQMRVPSLREIGAETFLDETSILKGANFKQIIHREIALSNEVIALFTPWSAKRSWVWIEMGAAWGKTNP